MYSFTYPHVASFNFVIDNILEIMVKNLHSLEFKGSRNERISLFIEELKFCKFGEDDPNLINQLHSTTMLPTECKLRGQSYFGVIKLIWCLSENGIIRCQTHSRIDQIPIMVMSNLCKLHKLMDFELQKHGHEINEAGGYFIVNGQEKLLRLLLVQRQNFPIALIRDVWMHKGDSFSDKGLIIRCVTRDFSVSLMTFHFMINGFCSISISVGRHAFSIPFIYILKALIEASDFEIFQELMSANPIDHFLEGCVVAMLRSSLQRGLLTQSDFLCYLGKIYRIKFDYPEWYTDIDLGRMFLKECVCIHLIDPIEKFQLLIEMCHKLYSLAQNIILPDNADSPMFQEVLLPGFIYLSVLRSAVINWLRSIRSEIERYFYSHLKFNFQDFANTFKGNSEFSTSISNRLINFFATGNAPRDVIGVPQFKGLTILADRVNYHRYFSHFCSIHRGHFFTEVRTTTVRKLLPDAMGFTCPVNTPDGTPCGLLTHLTKSAFITIGYELILRLKHILLCKGMVPIEEITRRSFLNQKARNLVRIFLDGRIIGYCSNTGSLALANALRHLKVLIDQSISPNLEIVCPWLKLNTIFQGIFIFSSPGRFMRPLYNIHEQSIEMVGSFEQAFLQIGVNTDLSTTHSEIDATNMLSVLATLTPFSDHNQSPRNIYQCQMSKQSMGTPCHSYDNNSDNRIYRILTPQTPIIRPIIYSRFMLDQYPQGINAVVAVISYSGYDMEDAVIISKYSCDRGFAYGCVYKNILINLIDTEKRTFEKLKFGLLEGYYNEVCQTIDTDGLPIVGSFLMKGMPFYAYFNTFTMEQKIQYYQHEECWVEKVTVLGLMKSQTLTEGIQTVSIKLRIPRNATIGDKFASRHGQKGICSKLWSGENMPFSETGIIPDILFNPHGFPSRMTIGMIIEIMAGKSASVQGSISDSTAFHFSNDKSAFIEIAENLTKAGYNSYGIERMYSGLSGLEFEADIFLGTIYYQRLRHMVTDKFQVRTTGPVNPSTHQPVHGRKRVGGMRFGEMERDCLLSHGASFLLKDRLMNCSDKALSYACINCGSIVTSLYNSVIRNSVDIINFTNYNEQNKNVEISNDHDWACNICQDSRTLKLLAIPFVFRLLIFEMASMKIKFTFRIK